MEVHQPNRYYDYSDLVYYARQLASTISQDTQILGIAGVPRSGMLAATAAAIHLGVPLFEARADGIRDMTHGRRLDNIRNQGRIVVMEDSLNTGRRFDQLKARLGDRHIYASVFSTPQSVSKAHYVAVELQLPHWFDWWLFGSRYMNMSRIGIDFDGILCGDCPASKDTDDEQYRDWMANVLPIRHAWPYGAPVVITGRLEKYRQTTEDWLRRNRQKIGTLAFGPWNSIAERRRGGIAMHKAKMAKELKLTAFIESDARQAQQIAELAQIPVACPEAKTVYGQKI